MSFEYVKCYHKTKSTFQKNLLVYLIIEYNQKVKNTREKVELGQMRNKLGYIPQLILLYKNRIIDNIVMETIRVIDIKEAEY